tara:strand:- start:1511 stop:2515 length:1005 start_codon:yes stop_codon:yes gene_type:complete
MAVTSFKYASISDLSNYFNRMGDYDSKAQLFNPSTNSNLHTFHDSGYVDKLFINGDEQGASNNADDTPNANGEWLYTSAENKLEYYNDTYTSTTINNQIFEAGQDFTDFINQQLVNASMELNNILDSRYPTPLPKNTQISESAASGLTSEYDAIIIKATCYVCASNLIRSKDPINEEADYYYNLVTNADGTGITDRLNKGEFKLSFEVDNKDSQGSIRKITQTGSMQLVETAGQYFGEPYDILRITCTTAGAYGVAKVKVEYFGNDKLFGQESTDNIITGGLDGLSGLGGLYVRYQGSSMAENDQWEIEVMSEARKISNAQTGTINLSRIGKIL